MENQWFALRHRLVSRGLMPAETDTLSLRIPGERVMLWGTASDAQPRRLGLPVDDVAPVPLTAALTTHRRTYRLRDDVCAVLWGGGAFGRQLEAFGGRMPAVFDEQIRQLGRMGAASDDDAGLRRSLAQGSNVALHAGQVLLLGMTPSRLAMNAELFEKCAKAYVPAVAGGAHVRTLPWLVRYIANGRLMKEEARAREQVQQGLWPAETRGY
ncbi:Ribulose-5-phosphate 4-epimerase/Fuculose-1-phosphate aldolase [Roseateles sp. YR242]|uniref:hypothetical protein n=1 Tax=Roseateles sp. YR242 TaxID=1855305 RepID=UPI0008C27D69|nr:hypothetical protein [Roseateles sp. YR242]SEL86638.1 Ribulose-5-phosphate 4-epimerase/Fuculose-1-phosphate aldolase [Roseateles sp. YR242]